MAGGGSGLHADVAWGRGPVYVYGERLKEAADETGYLVRTALVLGPRLGVILFHLPPNLKKAVERLRAFLALLPAGLPAAFEFRHPTWHDDEVFEALRGRGTQDGRGVPRDRREPARVTQRAASGAPRPVASPWRRRANAISSRARRRPPHPGRDASRGRSRRTTRMGKGDQRTEKGKRRRGTHGKTRPKKVKKAKPAGPTKS